MLAGYAASANEVDFSPISNASADRCLAKPEAEMASCMSDFALLCTQNIQMLDGVEAFYRCSRKEYEVWETVINEYLEALPMPALIRATHFWSKRRRIIIRNCIVLAQKHENPNGAEAMCRLGQTLIAYFEMRDLETNE